MPVTIGTGDRVDLTDVTERLVAAAYTRVDMVEKRGEFAVRGGILDVFPPTADHPVRVEFFGDEVEELRAFSVADQRSLPEPVERVAYRDAVANPASLDWFVRFAANRGSSG